MNLRNTTGRLLGRCSNKAKIVLLQNKENINIKLNTEILKIPNIRSTMYHKILTDVSKENYVIQGGSNITGTDVYVNKPHCAAAVRP